MPQNNNINQVYLNEIIKSRTKIYALEKKEHESTQLIETLDMKLYLLRKQLNEKDDEIIALQKKIYNIMHKNKANSK
jgi:chaperonin cofactor prefoldin